MKLWKTRLSIVLAFQLLLAAGLWALNLTESGPTTQAKLISLKPEEVDLIQLDSEEESVLLQKVNGSWTLPEYFGLKAEQSKVDSLISRLNELKTGDRVSQTDSAHERFELGEKSAQTEITIMNGDTNLAHLLVGKSPRFGKRYIRLKDQDDVYQVDWDAMNSQVKPESWIDQDVLKPGPLSKIAFADFTLAKNDSIWETGDESLDQEKVLSLVKKVEGLRPIGATDKTLKADFEMDLTPENGEIITWEFFQDNGKFFVKSSEHETAFQIAGNLYDQFKKMELESLEESEDTDENKDN